MKIFTSLFFLVSVIFSFSAVASGGKGERKPNALEADCGIVERVSVGRTGTSYSISEGNGSSSRGFDAKTPNYSSLNSTIVAAYASGKRVCITHDSSGNALQVSFGE